jgi:DNA-binding PadR family transcriptional regulator
VLKYGVLGLLVERPGYGYDLAQRLSERLGASWQLTQSSVYTALDQLEQERHVEAVDRVPAAETQSEGRRSRRAPRIVYEATELGAAEFRAWLARPSTRVDRVRSEILLKVAIAGRQDVRPLLSSIEHEQWAILHDLDERRGTEMARRAGRAHPALAGVRQQAFATAKERAAPDHAAVAATTWAGTAGRLVDAAIAARLEGELAWILLVRDTLRRITDDQPHPGRRALSAPA